ncbi:MAG TPA: GNAT family N-acetyltransferase [Kofleriaceae bacterium]|jgi:GNAT superfamily N-acetyltransferase|nr:GNAT family N-acetyltransferase [Kofleriaceae bacterium]
MKIEPLARAMLAEAQGVLARACAHDDAAAVAEEKLFGAGPNGAPEAWLARDDRGAVIGVAAAGARWLRVLAVMPEARGRGAGSALLAAAEDAMRPDKRVTDKVVSARAVAEPGNYLAPGIDERNVETIAWLERRGWTRGAERNTNVLIDVATNDRVSKQRADELAAASAARGYAIRRARRDEEGALCGAIASEFGGAWPFEIARALAFDPPGVHLAIAADGSYAAFAAHDGNNQGLGWFGPAGTWPAHRGQGLGEAVLLACLVDVGERHARCEVAWIGPRPFYEKAAGIIGERRFWPMTKQLEAR